MDAEPDAGERDQRGEREQRPPQLRVDEADGERGGERARGVRRRASSRCAAPRRAGGSPGRRRTAAAGRTRPSAAGSTPRPRGTRPSRAPSPSGNRRGPDVGDEPDPDDQRLFTHQSERWIERPVRRPPVEVLERLDDRAVPAGDHGGAERAVGELLAVAALRPSGRSRRRPRRRGSRPRTSRRAGRRRVSSAIARAGGGARSRTCRPSR